MPVGLLTIGLVAAGILALFGSFGPDCSSDSAPPYEAPRPRPQPYPSYVLDRELERERERRIQVARAAELQRRENLRQREALRQQELFRQQELLRQELLRAETERQLAAVDAAQKARVETPSGYFSDDEVVGNDADLPESAQYDLLRKQAQAQSKLMKDAYAKAKRARKTKQLALATSYSAQGKSCEAERNRLNALASAWAYKKHNARLGPNVIDLHGQQVFEAIQRTDEAIVVALGLGQRTMRIIVGKGSHSEGLEPKLRPAIEAHLQKQSSKYTVRVDPRNSGALEVTLLEVKEY